MERDWNLLERVSRLDDLVWVGVLEVAALTGLAPTTIRARSVKDFPTPMPGLRHLKWNLGQVRAWMTPAEMKLPLQSQDAGRQSNVSTKIIRSSKARSQRKVNTHGAST